MAHSQLRAIYKSIEETNVMLGDKVVRVRGLDNLTTAVNAANLPLRLLLPVGSVASGRNLIILNASGSGRQGTWTIPELALIALAPQGKGLEDYAGSLVDYVVNFEAAFLDRRTGFNSQGWLVNNVALDTGMYEWPAESGVFFFGARCIHTVTELIS